MNAAARVPVFSGKATALLLGAALAALCAVVASCGGRLFNYPPDLCTVCDPAGVPGSPGTCAPGQGWLCPPDAGAPDAAPRTLPPLPKRPPTPPVLVLSDRPDRGMGTEGDNGVVGLDDTGAPVDDGAADEGTGDQLDADGADAGGDDSGAPAPDKAAAAKPGDKPKPDDKAKPAETPEAARLRRGFAALTRKQADIVRREQALKGKEGSAAGVEALKARAKSDPLAVMAELGADVDGLLDAVIANGKKPEPTASDEVAALKRRLDEKEAADKNAAELAKYNTWRDGVVSKVTAAGEKYDLVNSLPGQHETVVQTILAYHQQYGEILDVDTAAAYVEKDLAAALGKSKKYGTRQPAPAAAGTKANGSNGTPPKAKTGTQTLASVDETSDLPPGEDGLPTDDDERYHAVMSQLGFA